MGDLDPSATARLALLLAGGGSRVRRLVAEAADKGDVYKTLSRAGGLGSVVRAAVEIEATSVPDVLERAACAGWRWVVPGEAEFPSLVVATADPPLGLFICGRMSMSKAVAVVGSRGASPYGVQVARLLGEAAARAGLVLVSGMARGVDCAAHEGALAAGGESWAVWGTGPDRIYPREHAGLAEALAKQGALLTEYPPGTPPRRHHFPERNRILAGLAHAVVVVEAAARSGALVTARLAMEEGRDVLAVPGNIFSELSVGPNTLLRVGARPLLTPRDLYDALGVDPPLPGAQGDNEPSLLQHIPAGAALTVDEIASRSQLAISEVHRQVLDLELSGRLARATDGRILRVDVTPPRNRE